ncbi:MULTISPECIES: hypothetical protein [unclassified Streptomyces]|uniref:hypothetical protein n=1 Tax=unclassified Streptomyces TaxID=2593676 RepID=UPI002DDB6FAB|nr:hypothetical protein [Streptomyces sp. NBC_01788]WSB28743.1 hypothetical protein OIE49_24175 [Streptomyces sp. NBC_01788]
MSGEIISVIVASVGVGGTLASALITQILAQRAELRRSEQEERVRTAEQRASEDQRRIDQLRSCYVQLNAHDRHYRDAMLAYAYALKSGSADAEAVEVSSARRAQRDTRAEAQLVASDAVLELESKVNAQLTIAYRHLMKVAGESESSAHQTRLAQVIGLLDSIIPEQGHVRALMRLEVGAAQELPNWFNTELGLTTHQQVGS